MCLASGVTGRAHTVEPFHTHVMRSTAGLCRHQTWVPPEVDQMWNR
jgi:hypothetical protein